MSDMHQRAAQMRERVGQDYPDAWDFKEIRELVGVVESFARVDTAYGPKVVVTIREIDGAEKRWAVWLSQTALINRFRELDIREGELVGIRYLGEGEPARPGQNPPHRFRVEVDRDGERFDWHSVGDPDVGGRKIYDEGGGGHERAPAPNDDDIPF